MKKIFIIIGCMCLMSGLTYAQNELLGPIERIAIVRKISADGRFVVGKHDQNPKPAFMWNTERGNTSVIMLDSNVGEAYDVTNDSIIVGSFKDPEILFDGQPVSSAGYWKDGIWDGLGLGAGAGQELPDDSFGSSASAVTEDGLTVVGFSKRRETTSFYAYPYSWTKNGDSWTENEWAYPSGGESGAAIVDISADGSLAVGWTSASGASNRKAIIWTSKDDYELLYPDTDDYSEFICISHNGNYAGFRGGGRCGVYNTLTKEKTILPDGFIVNDVSDNGIAVGAYRVNSIDKGFIWSQELGFMDFGEFVADFASDITLPTPLISLNKTNTYRYILNAMTPDATKFTIWTDGFRTDRGKVYVLSLESPIQILPYPKNLVAEVSIPDRNIVALSWEAPELDGEELTGYSIIRDGAEIVTVEANVTSYNDQDVPEGNHTYIVKSIFGTETSRGTNTEEVTVVGSYDLPLIETFSSNTFETNYWTSERLLGTINSPSWIIYNDAGIYSGSGATVEINPSSGQFNTVLSSKYLDAREAENVYLYFATKPDYFLMETQMPTMDTLYVEIYNYNDDLTTTTYSTVYILSMGWKSEMIDISEFAAGKLFKVNFRIEGVNNTINIKRIFFDDVRVVTTLPSTDSRPENLIQNVNEDKIQLAWQNSTSEMYGLTYANASKEYSIGNAGANFIAVNNYEREDLEIYNGLYLKSITAYISNTASEPVVATRLKIAVFRNGERVADSDATGFMENAWNTFELTSPVLIDGDVTNLKFGIEVVAHDPTVEPIGCDGTRSPVTGKGDVYSDNGGNTWTTLTAAGKVNNWCIIGNVAEQSSTAVRDANIIGYNVYREGEVLNDYLIFGQSYTTDNVEGACYTVRSYSLLTGQSADSEIICAENNLAIDENLIEESMIYPNPASTIVYINGGFKEATIYDLNGRQLMNVKNQETISLDQLKDGVYLLKLTTENGNLTRKLVINK